MPVKQIKAYTKQTVVVQTITTTMVATASTSKRVSVKTTPAKKSISAKTMSYIKAKC